MPHPELHWAAAEEVEAAVGGHRLHYWYHFPYYGGHYL